VFQVIRSRKGVARRTPGMVAACGALLGTGLFACSGFAASSCALHPLADLPARFNGGLVIDVSINGVPAKFLLATGASFTSISRSFATRLNIPIKPGSNHLGSNSLDFSINTPQGTHRPDSVTVSEIKVGDMVASYGHLVVMDEGGDGTTDQIAGRLGLDYLNKVDIELDPAQKRVRLFTQIDCPDQSAYWAAEHFEVPVSVPTQLPVVPVVIDGEELRAYLNTNSSHSFIEFGVAKARLGLPDNLDSPPPSRIPDGGTPEPDPSYVFKELVFGPITVKNPKLNIHRFANIDTRGASHIKTTLATDVPAAIGMDIIGKFHSMISLGNHMMYFTLPNERSQPAALAAKP
jgi:hypothetical protein